MGKYAVTGVVTTYRKGTIVVLEDKTKRGAAQNVLIFHDKNRNKKLDRKDKILISNKVNHWGYNRCVIPRHCIRYPRMSLGLPWGFRVTSVTARDIRKFGKEISNQFKKAVTERREIRRISKPLRRGDCDVEPSPTSSRVSLVCYKNFSPPLSISSKRAPKSTRYKPHKWVRLKTVDPRKCHTARGWFTARLYGRRVFIQLAISDLNRSYVGGVDSLLRYFGLKSNPNLVHATLMDRRVVRNHIDLNK